MAYACKYRHIILRIALHKLRKVAGRNIVYRLIWVYTSEGVEREWKWLPLKIAIFRRRSAMLSRTVAMCLLVAVKRSAIRRFGAVGKRQSAMGTKKCAFQIRRTAARAAFYIRLSFFFFLRRLPAKAGSMLIFIYTFACIYITFSVVRCTTLRAHNNIIICGKRFPANGTFQTDIVHTLEPPICSALYCNEKSKKLQRFTMIYDVSFH